jgi:hypothetical protein
MRACAVAAGQFFAQTGFAEARTARAARTLIRFPHPKQRIAMLESEYISALHHHLLLFIYRLFFNQYHFITRPQSPERPLCPSRPYILSIFHRPAVISQPFL